MYPCVLQGETNKNTKSKRRAELLPSALQICFIINVVVEVAFVRLTNFFLSLVNVFRGRTHLGLRLEATAETLSFIGEIKNKNL